jgi:alkenylglycerophosphocholine/alkenylglycerophosphoethanolamine hydrolase
MKRVPVGLVIVYLLSAALALIGCEAQAAGHGPGTVLKFIFKPLTTILLYGFIGKPRGRFQLLVAVGIFFSLVGDVALLFQGQVLFAVGLLGFLAAHLCYIIAFVGVGRWSARVAAVAALMLVSTGILLALVLPGAQGAVRIGVTVYAAALATMVTAAWSTPGGRLAWATPAAVGSVLFYVGDASLALDAFRAPIPHAWLLTIGVYWLGQLGITLAARSAVTGAAGGPSR